MFFFDRTQSMKLYGFGISILQEGKVGVKRLSNGYPTKHLQRRSLSLILKPRFRGFQSLREFKEYLSFLLQELFIDRVFHRYPKQNLSFGHPMDFLHVTTWTQYFSTILLSQIVMISPSLCFLVMRLFLVLFYPTDFTSWGSCVKIFEPKMVVKYLIFFKIFSQS